MTALTVGRRLRYVSPVTVDAWPGVKTSEAEEARHRARTVCMVWTASKCFKQRLRGP